MSTNESAATAKNLEKFSFLDHFKETKDFVSTLSIALKGRRIENIRKSLRTCYNNIPDQIVWNELPESKEGEGYSEYNSKEWLVQRFYYSHLGIQAAHSISQSRKYRLPLVAFATHILIFLIVFVMRIFFNLFPPVYLPYFNGALVLCCLALGGAMIASVYGLKSPIFSYFILPKRLLSRQQLKETKDLITDCILKTFDESKTPADLKDRFRNLVVDKNGQTVDGRLMGSDIEVPTFFDNWTHNLVCFYVVIMISILIQLMASGIVFSFLLTLFWIILLVIVIISFFIPSTLENRIRLSETVTETSTTMTMIDQVGERYFQNIESARQLQINNASQDKSPFFKLGQTTGQLHDRRDPFSPSEAKLPMGLSLKDLSVHLFVWGATGKGKTSGVLRPLVHQWIQNHAGGALIMDGKGALPEELITLSKDYKLINPETTGFAPIENLNPDEIADAFFDMMASPKGEKIWDMLATKLIRSCAIVMSLCPDVPYTLTSLYKIMSNDDYVKNIIIPQLPPKSKMPPYQLAGVEYRLHEFRLLPSRTKGSILSNASTWVSSLTDHILLSEWANTEKGVSVEDACKGELIGLNLPESKYGQAGKIIAAMAKKRFYKAIKNRGDNWKNEKTQKAVLLMVDEIQGLLTEDESAMLPIARSLGLSCVFATQNIDGIINKMQDEHAVNQMLGNFRSFIAFPSYTDMTNKYISKRLGYIWKTVVESSAGLIDTRYELNVMLNNPTEQILRESSALKYKPKTSAGLVRTLFKMFTSQFTDQSSSKISCQVKNVPIIGEDEIDSCLAEPNKAIACFERGRVPRRDIIELNPIYS